MLQGLNWSRGRVSDLRYMMRVLSVTDAVLGPVARIKQEQAASSQRERDHLAVSISF